MIIQAKAELRGRGCALLCAVAIFFAIFLRCLAATVQARRRIPPNADRAAARKFGARLGVGVGGCLLR